MLSLNPEPSFTVDVPITIPGKEEVVVSITYKYRSKKEFQELREKHEGASDDEWFSLIVEGWDGIDAEFNKENAAIFVDNYPAAAMEIALEYPKQLLTSRLKN